MQNTTGATDNFQGCEFSMFRAKADVSDEQLIAACQKMEKEFLSSEEGFIRHSLLKGDSGSWADVVFTKSKEDAERICRNFMGNSACLEYLQLIEEGSANLTFWSCVK
ncbi:hypothetical protein [Shewanella baltica]|uniref:hypothetical protein n=1 Tax=Shewanella baltica TaxID=62322 RepID=UPI0001E10AF0|nr:hypothetical protein [Shewanella baltica]AEG13025.1 hypothetical protein Sbal175_3801 [Shewanella baltica BA175]EHQ13432.1 hypothetical protein Sbal183_0495 [Shewanella baltica OS183]